MGSSQAKPSSTTQGNVGATWPNGEHADAILSVFFEGTGNPLRPHRTQIGMFAVMCAGDYVTKPNDITETAAKPFYKMAFDGCGVTNGVLGTLFAQGLSAQCNEVADVVRALAARNQRLRVNALGLSRGGIACMILANTLQAVAKEVEEKSKIDLAMLLFDPVPGNFITTGFPFTHTFAQDMRQCSCLKRVLALYPYEPLPDIALHAPIFGQYPSTCQVEEDVMLGCHQGALQRTNTLTAAGNPRVASNLAFCRIYDFLTSVGTELDINKLYGCVHPSRDDCLKICNSELSSNQPSTRYSHDPSGKDRRIVRRSSAEPCVYLNRYHEQLDKGDAVLSTGHSDGDGESPSRGRMSRQEQTIMYMLDVVSSRVPGGPLGSSCTPSSSERDKAVR